MVVMQESHAAQEEGRPVLQQSLQRSSEYIEIGQDDEPQIANSDHNKESIRQGWTPFWCKRLVILGFFAVFVAILITLEVVNAYSNSHHGLGEAAQGMYYLWTYAPTAVFTLVLAFWNRVDYRVRQMQPWTILISGDRKSARQNILLNYISPTRPEICWHSTKNKHWTVLMSSIIVLSQTLIIVVSTSLFTLSSSPKVLEDIAYNTNTRFLTDMSHGDPGRYLDTGDFDSAAVAGYIYDASQSLNLSYPFGTTSEHVYQRYSIIDRPDLSMAIQQANVDVLDIEYECEPAELAVSAWYASTGFDCTPVMFQNFNITSSNCTSNYLDTYGTPVTYGEDGEVSFFAFFMTNACGSMSQLPNTGNGFTLGVGLVQQSGQIITTPPSNSTTCSDISSRAQMSVLRSQQWNCHMTPFIRRASVSFNATELSAGSLPEILIPADAPSRVFANVSSFWKVNYAWEDASRAPLASLRTDSLPVGILSPHTEITPFLDHVLRSITHVSQDDILKTDALLDATKRVATSVFMQNAQLTLVEDDDSEVIGSAIVNLDRLVIRQVSLRLIESALAITLVLLLLLTYLMPHKASCPNDPVSLEGICEVLESSQAYRSIFKGLGAASSDTLEKTFGSSKFASRFQYRSEEHKNLSEHKFVIEKMTEADDVDQNQEPPRSVETDSKWWRPWTISILCRSLMAAVVIVIIVVLQVLLKLSSDRKGLATVSATNEEHLAWSLIPATAMTGVALYLGAVDSVYRTFGPFHRLRKGTVAAPSILAHYLSQTRVELLVTSLRYHQVALLFITICTIISAFFTIVVSGVFAPSQIPSRRAFSIDQVSWFQTTGSDDNGTIGNSGKIAGLILEYNLSYPSWTFQDLAFGSWQSLETQDSTSLTDDQTTLQATIPAIRASLNCTLSDQQNIPDLLWYNSEIDSSWESPIYVGVVANLVGGSKCQINTSNASNSLVSMSASSNNPPFSWYGFSIGSQPNCPLLNFYWGRQDPDEAVVLNHTQWDQNATKVTYARALSCFEVVGQVNVATTFRMPDLQIDEINHPVPDESTVSIFSSAAIGIPYGNLLGSGQGRYTDQSAIFEVLNTTYGFDLANLGDQDYVDTIVDHIKSTHGVIRAQQYNNVLRQAVGSDQRQSIQGVLIDAGRWRLIQNPISTHVLCGLLAAALVCAAIASFLINTKQVLPKDPCTIAAMTSLLADSNLLTTNRHEHMQDLPRRSSWWRLSSRKSRKHLPYKNATYKMDFFERGSGDGKVFTIYRFDNSSAADTPLNTRTEEHAPATVVESEPVKPQFPTSCPPRKPVPTSVEQMPSNIWNLD